MSKKHKQAPGTIAAVATGWRDTAFICRKCTRKLDGGFGADGKESLRQALRDALRRRGRRGQLGLVQVGCLGICPKAAVTIGLASRPGELLTIARHASADTILDRASL